MDYTSLANLQQYGPIDGALDNALLTQLVTAVSGTVDQYCSMHFGAQSPVNEVHRAVVDADGLLTTWLEVPALTSVAAAAWKPRTLQTWTTIDPATLEWDSDTSVTILHVLGQSFLAYRVNGPKLQLRLSYTSGWANLAAVPSDFELAVRRLTWWEYKKRDAPDQKMASLELGIVIDPSAWPTDLKLKLRSYTRQQALWG